MGIQVIGLHAIGLRKPWVKGSAISHLEEIPAGYAIVIDSNGDIVTDNVGHIIIART